MLDVSRKELLMDLVIELVRRRWQYDLSVYARASLLRRIEKTIGELNLSESFDFLPLLFDKREVFEHLVANLSVTVTEMFRDPEVYRQLKSLVFPQLSSYPFIRVWHAGCATGEEMYSLAILLDEAKLLDKTTLHGTDINAQSLKIAEEGIYPLERLKQYAQLYREAGGQGSFADYFVAAYGAARMNARLRERMTFAQHDLSGDEVFGEFHLILCRNVLIYFSPELQLKVINLFKRSLKPLGYLCLGLREYLPDPQGWQTVARREQIYRLVSTND